jgi:hypothetical protein
LHEYSALLKTHYIYFWCDVLPCHYDPHWRNNTLYFLVCKLTWTHNDSQFSPQVMLAVLRILNSCVPDFYVMSVVWWCEFRAVFVVFNWWTGAGFIFEFCANS